MKQSVILLVLMALAGILFGMWMLEDAGYVLIIRDGWQMETTLGFALFVLILAATSVAIVTLVLATVWDILSPFGAGGRWRDYLARQRMVSGFYALVEGRWAKAERLLSAAAGSPKWRVMAALGAAQAAAEQHDDTAVRRYLEMAHDQKRGRLAAGLMAAHLALDEGYPGEARNELNVLRDIAPKNPRLIRMLAETLAHMEDWSNLMPLLPALRQHSTNEKAFYAFERRAWHGWLKQTADGAAPDTKARIDALRNIWKKMPAPMQREATLRAQYAGYLAQFGDGEAALSVIRKDIESQWDDRLPAILECIQNVAPERLLALLEGWLDQRPGNPVLLLTAGRVALRAQLWGKARAFFESAGNAGNATALAELARLSAAMGDNKKALMVLEERLRLMDAHLPDLPMPVRLGVSE